MHQQIQSYCGRAKIQDERISELQDKCNDFIKSDMLKDRKAKALDAELKTMDAQKQKLQVDYNLMSN